MLGYFFALLMGLTLGLLGGGGSILTVPILVYVLKMDPKLSIGLSLAIVGITSLFGVVGHLRQGNVDFKVAVNFAPAAMIGTFVGARLARLLTGEIQLLLFAIIMLIAAIFMFKGRSNIEERSSQIDIKLLLGQGFIVGIITGIVGVGGGFLIVPALVLLAGIPVKRATGTSLLLIALNSITGFIGYLGAITVPRVFLGIFSFFSIIGIFSGTFLVKYTSPQILRKTFAIFLVFMGSFIIIMNIQ